MDIKNKEDLNKAIQYSSDTSGCFCKYQISDEEAQKIISTFIDDLLDNPQIKKKLRFYEHHLYESDDPRERSVANEQLREFAKALLLKKFCRVPEIAFSRISEIEVNERKRKSTFKYEIGFYENSYIWVTKFYLLMALNNLKVFPFFGLEYDSLKTLIKNTLQENTEKTMRETFKKGCWNNIPAEIRESKRRLKSFEEIYSYLRKNFCIFLSSELYLELRSDYLKIGYCFTPFIIGKAQEILSNLVTICDTKPPLAISMIEELIIFYERFLDSYRTPIKEEGEFKTIEQENKFLEKKMESMVSVIIYAVLQGMKPMIEEYRRGDLNGFIKEWFPVFLKNMPGFKDDFSNKIHPRRWYPDYFENPLIFAKNALEWEFEKFLKMQQKLKPNWYRRPKKGKGNDEDENGEKAQVSGSEYQKNFLDFLDNDKEEGEYFYIDHGSEKVISPPRPYKDKDENNPRRLYFKTNQIADLVGCSSRILRRKYLPDLIKEGLLSEKDVYRKKTDNLIYDVWRICAPSKEKVVELIKAKINKKVVKKILSDIKGKTPKELKLIESKLLVLSPAELKKAWDNFRRKASLR